jgi:GT2 family glycosyltransferase
MAQRRRNRPALDATVVIPTYQRRESVLRLLRALSAQTFAPERFEVIVAMDGSTDGTRELLSSFEAAYRVRSCWHANRGRAAACNSAIRMSEGDVVVILDDDMEPAPGWLAAHFAAHAPGSRRCVMGAAPIVTAGGSPPLERYMAVKFNEHLAKIARPGHRFALRDFYSGNTSARRQVLEEVDLFDEDFTVYGHEDLELSLRLQRAGVELAFSDEAIAYQHWSKTFAEASRDAMHKGRTAILLAKKHPEALGELRLGGYERGPRSWRLARAALLLAAGHSPTRVPAAVSSLIHALEETGTRRLVLLYSFVLDFFYWVGVQDAIRRADDGDAPEGLLARALPRDSARLLLHR